MLHYKDFRELFMGDAGESSEARLLASGTDLHADVATVYRTDRCGAFSLDTDKRATTAMLPCDPDEGRP